MFKNIYIGIDSYFVLKQNRYRFSLMDFSGDVYDYFLLVKYKIDFDFLLCYSRRQNKDV